MSLILKLLEGKESTNYSRREILHDVFQDFIITELFLQSCKPNQKRKYAVLLIDAFKDEHDEYKNMIEVLKEANNQNIPVYAISNFKGKTSAALLKYKGSNWFSVKKKYTDAFKGTNLEIELISKGITDAIVMGYSELICVKDTAETASKMLRVHTSPDIIQGALEQDEVLSNQKIFLKYKAKSKKFFEEKTNFVKSYDELPIFRKKKL